MKLDNRTDWDTKDLRRLCLAVIKHVGSKHHIITVEYSKRRRYHGLAQVGGTKIWMYVLKENFNVRDFAQILQHEIGHNMKLRHEDMASCWHFNTDYCKDLTVNKRAIKEKPKVDLQKIRHEQARKKVQELASKLKRTETLLKKWQKKVRYYEKKNLNTTSNNNIVGRPQP